MNKKILIGVILVLLIGAVAVGISNATKDQDVEYDPPYEAYSYGLVEAFMEKGNPSMIYTMGGTSSVDMDTYHIEHGIIMWYQNGLHEVRYAVHVAYMDGEWVVGKVLIGDKDVYRNNDNMVRIGAM